MKRKQTEKKIDGHPTNTVHFACFDCRVSFKQPNSSNWDRRVAERPFDCPNCKQPMVRFGRHFKAPPKRAIRQWQKVELLFRFGERFESSNSGLDTRCATLSSTVAYLIEIGHTESEVRLTLKSVRDARLKKNEQRREQKTRSTDRLANE